MRHTSTHKTQCWWLEFTIGKYRLLRIVCGLGQSIFKTVMMTTYICQAMGKTISIYSYFKCLQYFTDFACLNIYCWVVYYMFYCQLGNEIPGAEIPTTTGLGESGHAVWSPQTCRLGSQLSVRRRVTLHLYRGTCNSSLLSTLNCL